MNSGFFSADCLFDSIIELEAHNHLVREFYRSYRVNHGLLSSNATLLDAVFIASRFSVMTGKSPYFKLVGSKLRVMTE